MRTLGLIGLVLALLIVGFTMKKQLATVAPSATPAGMAGEGAAPTVRAQSQQIKQQIKQQLDATMSQPRPMPDDN
ncbi:MAG: hypothetical protein DI563_12755 [Variovorax paradoxus]|uniref:Uncharacterized protein n=1 Tax=Variovorax paradoxus TaxID=34073 RepID=A0A2W5QHI2_VARPD|nr:MAG: hypothetical protein DI563_12755 [Variovorax paradoxus]